MYNIREWAKIAAAVLLPYIGAFWGSQITRGNQSWYNTLNQPTWNPPGYVFAPVWGVIYGSIGFASYMVYRDVTASATGWDQKAKLALILYAVQMIFNWAWPLIFFKYHSLKWSLVEIVVLTVLAIACAIAFYKINAVAGWIFLPYIAWLSFATVLNYTVYQMNGPDHDGNATTINPKSE